MADAEQLVLQTIADDELSGANAMVVTRTGITVDSVDFGAPITATSYGGVIETALVDKTATEVITGTWIFSGTAPGLTWNETDQTTDEKNWNFAASGGAAGFNLVNDAFAGKRKTEPRLTSSDGLPRISSLFA